MILLGCLGMGSKVVSEEDVSPPESAASLHEVEVVADAVGALAQTVIPVFLVRLRKNMGIGYTV